MLQRLREEVGACYAYARECARKADTAISDEMRYDLLRLQESWLNLARSYEFAEHRLSDFSKENLMRAQWGR